MANNFDKALGYVLISEGGNSDDPRDPGGRTSRGITQREYNAWASNNGKTDVGDVWYAPDNDIREIYMEQYWNPYCPKMPDGFDYLFFDMSVNCGRTGAVRQLQKALGVEVDGMYGQVTHAALLNQANIGLVKRLSDVRRDYYKSLRNFNTYGRGWLNRVAYAESNAISMVSPDTTIPAVTISTAKATDPAHPTVSPEASGVATGGLMTVLAGFKDQISGLSYYIPNINYILLGIAVLGLGYTAYSYWKKNKVNQAI